MKKVVLSLTALAALLGACTQRSVDVVVGEFPATGNLASETVNLENAELISYMGYAVGDYLLFNDKAGKYNFSVYDKSFAFVDTIVGKGGGPDELMMAMCTGQWKGSASSPEVLAYAPEKQRVVSFGVKPFGGLKTVVDFPHDLGLNPGFVTVVSDTMVVGLRMNPPAAVGIFAFNPATGAVRDFADTFEYNDNNAFYVSQKALAVSPEGYACAYFNLPWLVVRDKDFNVVRRIAIGSEVSPKTITDDFGNGDSGFTTLLYHGKHILALYSKRGETMESTLMAFTTDGEPVASYPMGTAMWFTVDASERIIAMNYDMERDEVALAVSPMPEELRK